MTRPVSPLAHGDPATLLRRIRRHVPFDDDRVVLALVRLSRSYVEAAAWLDAPATSPPVAPAEVVARVRSALRPFGPGPHPEGTARPSHAVTMVRCRRGRVVWLPADEIWLDALAAEAARVRLPVAEVFLITEHGWRAQAGSLAASSPALAA